MMLNKNSTVEILLEEFKKRIQELISSGNNFMDTMVKNQHELETYTNNFNKWNIYNSEYLKSVLGNNNEYKIKYDKAYPPFKGIFLPTISGKAFEIRDFFIAKLKSLDEILYISDILFTNSTNSNLVAQNMNNNIQDITKVFIVHGHNTSIREQVARTLEKLDLKAIILDEQASGGRTIIEKLEYYSNVQFAVILLTADDEGRKKDINVKGKNNLKDRARQNVILELGYFIAKLSRGKVVPLYEEGVELPNDIGGVVYVPLDNSGNWKLKLVQELQEAGYNVDANKLLK